MILPVRVLPRFLAIGPAGCSPSEKSLTVCGDIAAQSGLANYEGMTHAATWGDHDGDGLSDLYFTSHLKQAALCRNPGGDKFSDVTAGVINANDLGSDKYSSANLIQFLMPPFPSH